MPTVSAPPMDATSRVHNPSPGRHDPARRKLTRLDALMGIRVYDDPSPSQYGSTRFDITSPPPPLDVSLDVDGNPLHSHHDPRRRKLTPLLGVNMHHSTKDMSLRHVSSLHHPPTTLGHRMLMPMISTPPTDVSDHASLTIQYGSEYEAHNASIKDRLEMMMEEMGVTSLAR